MRALERATFDAGTSEAELQWRAGNAVASAILQRWPQLRRATAFVGTGNNGRDAWIAAQCLLDAGWEARLYLCPGHAISDDELGSFQGLGGEAVWHREGDLQGGIAAALAGVQLVIDGMLGIGARGIPREPLASVIEELNSRRHTDAVLRVISVDVPSGLEPDTGGGGPPIVKADFTVVLGAMKQGLLTARAAQFAGELVPADIGVVAGPEGAPELLAVDTVRGILPARSADAHKGSFGRLLVVAGSEPYVGAALLVCSAAVRSGVGLVTLAAPRWLRAIVAPRLPEITYLLLSDNGAAWDPGPCVEQVVARLPSYSALAIGPGLTTEGGVPDVVEAILRVAAEKAIPTVVDADGLNVLAARPGWPAWIGPRTVFTPHLGELSRLTGETIHGDGAPWALAGSLAREWGITLVIKGPYTAIGSAEGTWVHARPNPSLATAGTGDVLTGIIGGLLARGLSPLDAARAGVFVHGEAAARCSAGLTGGGMAASDLLGEIPGVLSMLVGD